MSWFSRAVLVCTLVALCVASHVDAITLHLYSTDFKHKAKESIEVMIANNNNAQHCILVELNDSPTTKGVVQFTYSSNASSTMRRLPLAVSLHSPVPNDGTIALPDLNKAEYIYSKYVYTADQLDKYSKKGDVLRAEAAQRQKQNTGGQNVPDNDEDMVKQMELSVMVPPVLTSEHQHAKAIPGYYGVCFTLSDIAAKDSQRDKKSRSADVELVGISIVEVSTLFDDQPDDENMERVSDGDGQEDKDDWTKIFNRKIRRIYNAKPDANVRDLVSKQPRFVSSEMTVKMLSRIVHVESLMFGIIKSAQQFEQRHHMMRSTTESTFTRIWISTIAIIAGISAMVWFTFSYTKRIIVKRKLV